MTLDFFRKPLVQPVVKLTKKIKQQQELKKKKKEAQEQFKVYDIHFIVYNSTHA